MTLREKILDQIDALIVVKESHTYEATREFYQGEIQALQWILSMMNEMK